MKVAIVHDWLTVYAGAERVLEQMIALYPEADLFSTVCFLRQADRGFLGGRPVQTSFIQKLPFARAHYRSYLPLMPLAVEQFDLSAYDLILSSSHAVAKGVITGPDQVHVAYVHSPIRYAWDLQPVYLREAGLERGLKSMIARYILHKIRLWDMRTANGVDQFVVNSKFIGARVRKIYRRSSRVIYPPVDVDKFPLQENKDDFYVTASRMVPYKHIPLIVEAFAGMPDKKLVVIGDGPQFDQVKAQAGPNVALMGYQPDAVLVDHLRRAKAFVFAAEEDFGILPVEAQAAGTPVIAYGKGGALETVRGLDHEAPTGVLFDAQTVASLRDAVAQFEAAGDRIRPAQCRANAEQFSPEQFKRQFSMLVDDAIRAHKAERLDGGVS